MAWRRAAAHHPFAGEPCPDPGAATNRAAATANGILGIFGYASTLISGVGFGYVAQHYGWNGAYLTILIMAVLGAITLLTMWGAKANGYEE